jgi:hypothetical protein
MPELVEATAGWRISSVTGRREVEPVERLGEAVGCRSGSWYRTICCMSG